MCSHSNLSFKHIFFSYDAAIAISEMLIRSVNVALVQLTTNSARIVLGAECECPLIESDAVAVAVAGVDVAVRARHDDDDGYMVRTIDDTISSKLGRLLQV
mmetsp:Transcript_17719/g.32028  ORF Transcript_17719/g.32028 Transcript_17719/m.32028 type:complete len:101 (-) Transcript_17719:147-449(-)